jgi:hypothetical protein
MLAQADSCDAADSCQAQVNRCASWPPFQSGRRLAYKSRCLGAAAGAAPPASCDLSRRATGSHLLLKLRLAFAAQLVGLNFRCKEAWAGSHAAVRRAGQPIAFVAYISGTCDRFSGLSTLPAALLSSAAWHITPMPLPDALTHCEGRSSS